jgi:hypothetical protein
VPTLPPGATQAQIWIEEMDATSIHSILRRLQMKDLSAHTSRQSRQRCQRYNEALTSSKATDFLGSH